MDHTYERYFGLAIQIFGRTKIVLQRQVLFCVFHEGRRRLA